MQCSIDALHPFVFRFWNSEPLVRLRTHGRRRHGASGPNLELGAAAAVLRDSCLRHQQVASRSPFLCFFCVYFLKRLRISYHFLLRSTNGFTNLSFSSVLFLFFSSYSIASLCAIFKAKFNIIHFRLNVSFF